MRRLLWYGNSSGSDRNPNSSDNPVCLSVQSYGTYCQHVALFVEATYVIRVPDIYVEGTKLVEMF
jgi:hypothetical protein